MTDELVRVKIRTGSKTRLTNMGRALAEDADNVEILEGEPTHRPDGTFLGTTFESGRPLKSTTTVATEATQKAADRSVSTDEKKEQDR